MCCALFCCAGLRCAALCCAALCFLTFSPVHNSDDCISIKSGMNKEGRAFGRPATNILIERVQCRYGDGLALGSEMSGGIENVTIRNIEVFFLRFGLPQNSIAVSLLIFFPQNDDFRDSPFFFFTLSISSPCGNQVRDNIHGAYIKVSEARYGAWLACVCFLSACVSVSV
jgi:hypothetical protein